MARTTATQYDRLELDTISDSKGTYTKPIIDSGNKIRIRFPDNINYTNFPSLLHLTMTLKIEET
jgi:hypothetical protein